MPQNLIKDYMCSPVLSVDTNKTIREAAKFMMHKKTRSLLVNENGHYAGIVTKTDFISKVYINESMDPEQDLVAEVMSKPVLSLDLNHTMEEARKLMQKNKIGHLAVTDKGKIISILSKTELTAYFGKLA